MNRPLGVTIIAVIDIVFGLLGLCIGMVSATNMLMVGMARAVGSSLIAASLIIVVASAIAVFIVLLNGIQFYIGIGLLMMQKWAWTWARIIAIIAIAAGALQIVVSLFGGEMDLTFPIGTGLNSIIIQAIVLIYLSRPGMKEQFTY